MKTFMAKPHEVIRRWFVVDAADKILGRLACQVASCLRGKHKPEFTPHTDVGDNIIIINASKIKVTGQKLKQKIYYHYSGHRGGMKEIVLKDLLMKKPQQVIEHAVRGMLPHGALGDDTFMKLHVYAEANHPHSAQQPELLDLK